MKRLLVFVFAMALLGSCSKQRVVEFRTTISPDFVFICSDWCYTGDHIFYMDYSSVESTSEVSVSCNAYFMYQNGELQDHSTYVSDEFTAIKGGNISISKQIVNHMDGITGAEVFDDSLNWNNIRLSAKVDGEVYIVKDYNENSPVNFIVP